MSELTEALNRISNWAIRTVILQEGEPNDWQTGLTVAEIEEIVKDLPLRLPQEVYELYHWRNGCLSNLPFGADPRQVPFYSWFICDTLQFLPLQTAVQIWKDEAKRQRFDSTGKIPFLFPIFSSEDESVIAVILHQKQQETSLVVRTYGLYGQEAKTIASSITNIMLAQAEYLELESRNIDYREICRKYKCKTLL